MGLFSISLVLPILFPFSLSLAIRCIVNHLGKGGETQKVPTGERKRKRRRRGRISPPELLSPPSPKYIFTILFLPSYAGDAAAALINTGREEREGQWLLYGLGGGRITRLGGRLTVGGGSSRKRRKGGIPPRGDGWSLLSLSPLCRTEAEKSTWRRRRRKRSFLVYLSRSRRKRSGGRDCFELEMGEGGEES